MQVRFCSAGQPPYVLPCHSASSCAMLLLQACLPVCLFSCLVFPSTTATGVIEGYRRANVDEGANVHKQMMWAKPPYWNCPFVFKGQNLNGQTHQQRVVSVAGPQAMEEHRVLPGAVEHWGEGLPQDG